VVKPDGILVFSLQSSPYVMAFYAVVAVAAWYLWRRSRAGVSAVSEGQAVVRQMRGEYAGSPDPIVDHADSRARSALVKP
jgi:hypothetical protein